MTKIQIVHIFRSIAPPSWVKIWISQPGKESMEGCWCELQLEISSVSSKTNRRWGCDSQSLGHICFGSSALSERQRCSRFLLSSSGASLSLHNKSAFIYFSIFVCRNRVCVCVWVDSWQQQLLAGVQFVFFFKCVFRWRFSSMAFPPTALATAPFNGLKAPLRLWLESALVKVHNPNLLNNCLNSQ